MKPGSKWLNAAIPALLIHCSIGTVYCWSIFSQEIADYIGFSKSATEWAFSFAIFFLGISAAFLGRMVEKDIKQSSLFAAVCFTLGMLGTGFFISYGGSHKGSLIALIGVYVSYGFIMGVGLGVGYLCPVKNLMLWFSEHKGLATGLGVAGFGAAKAIASPIMQAMLQKLGEGGIYKMFYILAGVYCVMMLVGHLLLRRPDGNAAVSAQNNSAGPLAAIKTNPRVFFGIWLMFYLNITCGLALISQEKMLIKCIGLASMTGLLSSCSAVFNAGGRLVFSAWADKLKDRNSIFKIILSISIAITALVLITGGFNTGGSVLSVALAVTLIMLINAGYGAGFSNVPALLSEYYGMEDLSAIYGMVLSAWAVAGLSGNQLAAYIVNHSGKFIDDGLGGMINPAGYQNVLYVMLALYILGLAVDILMVGTAKKKVL